MLWSETNIILAIIGMVGLFSTAVIWQRSNRITSLYYASLKQHSQACAEEQTQECTDVSAC